MGLEGKVCVVTGAGSGIGRAAAVEMARQGGKVVVSDVNDASGQETLAEITAGGGEAIYLHCDMRNGAEIEALMAGAVAAFGRLDVLHNNAGVHESVFTDKMTVQDVPLEVWDAVMDINLKGVFLAARAAYPHMKAAGGGSIVNAGSTASLLAFPMCPVYTTAKHGVAGLPASLYGRVPGVRRERAVVGADPLV